MSIKELIVKPHNDTIVMSGVMIALQDTLVYGSIAVLSAFLFDPIGVLIFGLILSWRLWYHIHALKILGTFGRLMNMAGLGV